jgi:L-lactate dehydrogenase complex protein LldE
MAKQPADACHGLRDLGVHDEPRRLLNKVEGLEFVEMENADILLRFRWDILGKYPRSRPAFGQQDRMIEKSADTVVACDASCLMQIGGRLSRIGSKIQAKHIAEILASQE